MSGGGGGRLLILLELWDRSACGDFSGGAGGLGWSVKLPEFAQGVGCAVEDAAIEARDGLGCGMEGEGVEGALCR